MLDRRQFLSGAGAVTLAELVPSVAPAATTDAGGRTVINAIAGYTNLAKGFIFAGDPTNQDINGYPIKTPAASWLANPSMPEGYFGDFVWKFRGRGSMQFSPGALIRSGGNNIVGLHGSSGDTNYNTTILDKTNPRVVLAFGAQIQTMSPSSVSNGAGGRRVRLMFKPGYAGSASSVIRVQALDGKGQAAAAGVWNCVRIDANTLDLVSNALTGQPAVWDSSDPYRGPGGEAIWQASNIAVYILSQGIFSGFSNLVFCKAENEALVDAGKIVDPELVKQLKYLKPAWLRFMDVTGVQASYENDFSRRVPVTSVCYPGPSGRFVPDYWVGTIKRGADDALTCASPAASRTGAYVDNEVIQGVIDFPNTRINPTLNVNGRGAKYIYDFAIAPRKMRFSGAIPVPDAKLVFRFAAPWLNGGAPYDVSYIIGSRKRYSDATFVGFKANLMDLFSADSVLSGKVNVWNSGDLTFHPITPQAGALSITYVSGPPGMFCRIGRLDPYNLAPGTNRARMRLSGTMAAGEVLSLTFTRADLPAGAYTLTYEVKIGTDKSLQILCASLNTAINNDATLRAAGISAYPHGLPPNTLDIQQNDTWAGDGLALSLQQHGDRVRSLRRGRRDGHLHLQLLAGRLDLAAGRHAAVRAPRIYGRAMQRRRRRMLVQLADQYECSVHHRRHQLFPQELEARSEVRHRGRQRDVEFRPVALGQGLGQGILSRVFDRQQQSELQLYGRAHQAVWRSHHRRVDVEPAPVAALSVQSIGNLGPWKYQ